MTITSPTRAAVAAHLTLVTAALAAIVGVLELTRGTLVAVQLIPFLLFLNLMTLGRR